MCAIYVYSVYICFNICLHELNMFKYLFAFYNFIFLIVCMYLIGLFTLYFCMINICFTLRDAHYGETIAQLK